jgi:hypothetical protein
MADYYPLISRAVGELKKNTGENRRAIYERARTALLAQLRGVTPALEESDITRERLTLEESIRKVEAEAARQFVEASRHMSAERLRRLRPWEPTPGRWSEPPPPGSARDPLAELARLLEQKDPFQEPNLSWPDYRSPAEDQAVALAEQRRRREEAATQLAENERRRQEEGKRLEEERRRQEEAKRLEEQRRRDQEGETNRRERRRRVEARRAELADVASPAPSLASDGRLDAGPNTTYDVAAVDDDLPTLPLRQRALIQTILSDLPGNAPKHLKASLDSYRDELIVRGAQPILGLLKDMAAIIEATVGAPDAGQEWLAEGMRRAFERFADNHALFVKHFPLDPKREELYARIPVDETLATGAALSNPFQIVAKASLDANKAGLTTDEFLKIVDKMAEFAKIISTLPPTQSSATAPPRHGQSQGETPVPFPVVSPEDIMAHDSSPVSPKKRVLLSGLGFFERVYNLLGSTATLASPAEGNALLTSLREAIAVLSKLIGL